MPETLPGLIFLLLSLAVVLPVVPFRWSLLAYLVSAHLDLSGTEFTSAVSLGVENAVRVVVLPTILLLRTRFAAFELLENNRVFHLWFLFAWIAFGLYVALASLWTPFPLGAVKQLGYLYAYTVALLVFVPAFFKDKEGTYRIVAWSLMLVLGMALIQTFPLGNRFGRSIQWDRFTSFTSPQGFGLYLALALAMVISFSHRRIRGAPPKGLLVPLLLLSIFLNGSRAALVSAIITTGHSILWWSMANRTYGHIAVFLGIISLVLAVILVTLFVPTVVPSEIGGALQTNRSLEVLGISSGGFSIRDVGTFRFRLDMYQTILNRIMHKPLEEVVFGSGTSSTAEIITLGYYQYRGYDQFTVDTNRVAHNEFLRVSYEWGVVGSILFVLVLATLFAGAFAAIKRSCSFEGYALATALFSVLLFLSVENVLAATNGPLGMGVVLLLAQLASLGLEQPCSSHPLAADLVTPVQQPGAC